MAMFKSLKGATFSKPSCWVSMLVFGGVHLQFIVVFTASHVSFGRGKFLGVFRKTEAYPPWNKQLLLMVQRSGIHQFSLVVEIPVFSRLLYIQKVVFFSNSSTPTPPNHRKFSQPAASSILTPCGFKVAIRFCISLGPSTPCVTP